MVTGRLVLVGTPIGNLEDMSPRAIAALTTADVIACEDTRHTGQLLRKLGITRDRIPPEPPNSTRARPGSPEADAAVAAAASVAANDRLPTKVPLLAVHDHNEDRQIERVIGRLRHGDTVVLVSDAGMPGISDPGERLVEAVIEAGISIEVVPGPTAGVAALVVSGLAAGRFCFEGFLPRKGSARTRRLSELVGERRTMVLFEAPHRLERTVADLVGVLGEERRVSMSREITKLYEETWRGTLAEAGRWASERDPRGEFVVVIEGAPEPEPADDDVILRHLRQHLDSGASVKDAVARVGQDLTLPKRRVYNLALTLDR